MHDGEADGGVRWTVLDGGVIVSSNTVKAKRAPPGQLTARRLPITMSSVEPFSERRLAVGARQPPRALSVTCSSSVRLAGTRYPLSSRISSKWSRMSSTVNDSVLVHPNVTPVKMRATWPPPQL